MRKRFEVILLQEAFEFIYSLDEKTSAKILYKIDKASYKNDPKLFKKLTDEIWEFRIKYNKTQYRLLAFWDKRNNKNTLVLSTHGFVKKASKTAKKELRKAEVIMRRYFDEN